MCRGNAFSISSLFSVSENRFVSLSFDAVKRIFQFGALTAYIRKAISSVIEMTELSGTFLLFIFLRSNTLFGFKFCRKKG